MMDRVQKLSTSECYTPSSEPIRIEYINYLHQGDGHELWTKILYLPFIFR
jgi:hypothetical protein